jgi:hypothetical protein
MCIYAHELYVYSTCSLKIQHNPMMPTGVTPIKTNLLHRGDRIIDEGRANNYVCSKYKLIELCNIHRINNLHRHLVTKTCDYLHLAQILLEKKKLCSHFLIN